MTRPAPAGGIGFVGALALLFIGLKLAGAITWPWLWVLAPLWAPVTIAMTLVGVAMVLVVVETAVEYGVQRAIRRRNRKGLPRASQHGPAHRWGPHDPDR